MGRGSFNYPTINPIPSSVAVKYGLFSGLKS